MKLLWIVVLSALPCIAQEPAPTSTDGIKNCRFWKDIEIPRRVGWLEGYHDGLFSGLGMSQVKNSKEIYENAFPQGLTFIEISMALDRFCAVPENARLPLLTASTAVAMKARGVAQSKIDEFVSGVLAQPAK
jgi:hypothetical protein